jgi:competence protein ComEC
MLVNPFVIFNSGFQMSFTAIIAITLIYPTIENILQLKNENLWRREIDKNNITKKQKIYLWGVAEKNRLIKSLLFSFCITLVMNPIIAYNYFQLPSYAFILNIIVVPFMSVVIVSGIAGIGSSFISVALGRLLILPACAVLEFYTKLCVLINKIPFSNIIVGKPSPVVIVIYYIVLGIFLIVANKIRNKQLEKEKKEAIIVGENGKSIQSKAVLELQRKRKNRKYIISAAGCCIILNMLIYCKSIAGYSLFSPKSTFTITFLDVGQGDGIFMRTADGTSIMIDGGSSSVDSVGQYRIIPFLKAQCIQKIDYAIVTHVDSDHISGLMEIIEMSDENSVSVKNLVMPDIELKDDKYNELIQTAGEHNVKVLYITKGNQFNFSGVNISCIFPSVTTNADDRNDYSTVLSVKYKNFSTLLTGDISTEMENQLQDMLASHYTILKVAHHGSKYSTSKNFLQWIKPDYSVISVGANNMYGHPSAETLERLTQSESRILRTDESGGITVWSDGEQMGIEKMIE